MFKQRPERIQLLEKARELIEQGWVQSMFAINDKNESCTSMDERACAWCLPGAIDAVAFNAANADLDYESNFGIWSAQLTQDVHQALCTTSDEFYEYSDAECDLIDFNDSEDTDKDMVLDLFTLAIKRLHNIERMVVDGHIDQDH